MTNDTFSIKNTTKGKLQSLPFVSIKEAVLGKKYELSLVFIGDKLSKKLNKKYRSKDKSTNILSFPLTEKEGEIFINFNKSKKEAPLFKRNHSKHILFLFIHGLFHLKGLSHGSRMEDKEVKIRKKFKV